MEPARYFAQYRPYGRMVCAVLLIIGLFAMQVSVSGLIPDPSAPDCETAGNTPADDCACPGETANIPCLIDPGQTEAPDCCPDPCRDCELPCCSGMVLAWRQPEAQAARISTAPIAVPSSAIPHTCRITGIFRPPKSLTA